jgi:isochorismate pyruvate lyase
VSMSIIDFVSMKQPSECSTIEEVRKEIDAIDSQIMTLFGKRFQFVKEVVKYKAADKVSIIAANRRAAVLQRIRTLAEQNGLQPDEFEAIYQQLIEHFIQEELKLIQ